MWRDPLDELIDDLERIVPEERQERLTPQDFLVATQAMAQLAIKRADAEERGEPVETIDAELQHWYEQWRGAYRATFGHDPESHVSRPLC